MQRWTRAHKRHSCPCSCWPYIIAQVRSARSIVCVRPQETMRIVPSVRLPPVELLAPWNIMKLKGMWLSACQSKNAANRSCNHRTSERHKLVTNTIRLGFDCNSTALQSFDDLQRKIHTLFFQKSSSDGHSPYMSCYTLA